MHLRKYIKCTSSHTYNGFEEVYQKFMKLLVYQVNIFPSLIAMYEMCFYLIKFWILEKTLPSPQPFLVPSWPLCSSDYRSADSARGWLWRRTQTPFCLCSWNGGSRAQSTWKKLSRKRWRQQWGGKHRWKRLSDVLQMSASSEWWQR